MTLQRQQVTVVIGARIGQPPIYPKIGQGLLGGTIEQVFIGDAVEAHAKLSELHHAFSVEFDRGELTVPALRLALWQAHWWRSLRPFAERAADLLHLGATSGIAVNSLAAQRCAEIEAALNSMTQERIPATPIADALQRGEPIPANDGLSRLELAPSSLSFGTCRPLCEADPQGLAEHHQAFNKVPGTACCLAVTTPQEQLADAAPVAVRGPLSWPAWAGTKRHIGKPRELILQFARKPTADEYHSVTEAIRRGIAAPAAADSNDSLAQQLAQALARVQELEGLINTPHTDEWFEAVRLEAAHQIERWGDSHDGGKAPADWFWLLGYLGQKAMTAAQAGDETKARHHTISSAAMLLNWFRAIVGDSNAMRPGIDASRAQGDLRGVHQ